MLSPLTRGFVVLLGVLLCSGWLTVVAAPLKIGLAAVDVTPPIGTPLGGFGGSKRRVLPWDMLSRHEHTTFLKPSEGIISPIRAKAMYIERGQEKLVFVSLDVLAITPSIRNAIIDKVRPLKIPADAFIVSATHTHSGPGALFDNTWFELLIMDAFDKHIFDAFIQGVADSIEEAVQNKQPATLYSVSTPIEGIQKNRTDPSRGFDNRANLLFAKSTKGHWLGGIFNFALHGTAFGQGNLKLTADVMGAIESGIEEKLGHSAVTLFINAACGDVTPAKRKMAALNYGRTQVAQQAIHSLNRARKLSGQWTLTITEARLGTPVLYAQSCMDNKAWYRSLVWSKIGMPLIGMLPHRTRLWSLTFDDILIATIPGEPTTRMGIAFEELAKNNGYKGGWLFSLTNDYLAYFTTEADYRYGGYEACHSLFRYQGGDKLLATHKKAFGLE